MPDTSDEAINERLSELRGLPTVSAYSHGLHELMAQLVATSGRDHRPRLALAGLLEVQVRYHSDLERLGEVGQVEYRELQALGDRHRIGLRSILELARHSEAEEILPEAARLLIIAECCYHLNRTAEVVTALEQVVALGLDQPLIHFALGYNLYLQALEECTQPGEKGKEAIIEHPVAFQLRCLQAVSALERGVGGESFDEQLYWWMGVILEAAGLTEAAQDAYDKSTTHTKADPHKEASERGGNPFPDGRHTPITDDEVSRAAALLEGRFDRSELWPEDAAEM